MTLGIKRGGERVGQLAKNIMEELNCDVAFSIPLFGGIEVVESVVITWSVMAIMLALSIILTSNLKVENISKRQMIVETTIGGLQNMLAGIVGEKGKKYVPYLATIIIYISISNMIGIFGVKPPTKDLNVTAALALMSIILIEWAGISKKGIKHWFKHFIEPVPIVAPINILEIFIRPLSLCMRLFGNVLGAFVVMELIKMNVPAVVPVPFSLYFDIFDGLIQAYVFVFLTSLFIKEAIE